MVDQARPLLIVRPAVPADAEEMEKIFYFAHIDAGLHADFSLQQMRLLTRLLDEAVLGDFRDVDPSFIDRDDRALFVAEDTDNVPYGMTAIVKLSEDSAEIQRVAVDPTRQGGGAAKKLMTHPLTTPSTAGTPATWSCGRWITCRLPWGFTANSGLSKRGGRIPVTRRSCTRCTSECR